MSTYTDPCGCTTTVYNRLQEYIYTHKKLCKKHRVQGDIEMVERRIRDLEARQREATAKYQKELDAYLERLKQLKNK